MWLARFYKIFAHFHCLYRIRCNRSEIYILLEREKEEIGEPPLRRHVRRCTFRDAHAEIVEPTNVSKPAECRNYSLRCTLCSGFLCSSVPVLTLRRCLALRSRGCAHTFSLSPSLRLHLYGQPRSSVSRLPSCDNPTPPCVNSCTHRQRIRTGEHTAWATFTLHNAGDLYFFLCATILSHYFENMPKGHFFHKIFASIYKTHQVLRKHICDR